MTDCDFSINTHFKVFVDVSKLLVQMLHLKFSFIPKLFYFGHFFEWVDFHIFVDREKTTYSRTLKLSHIKLISSGCKMTSKQNVCNFCVLSYSRLV